jgi:HTH-type transcriptional repressor of NAD biosynthesis genes
MLLGKFMPPHMGHAYLCDFAQAYVDELAVVVGSLSREPIDGALRAGWMRELAPRATVVHLTDENPQQPEEHPEFWRIWRESLLRVLPWPVDFVFAGEAYGARLASELGAAFVPVPRADGVVPISATRVREDPMGQWDFLALPARAHYARRVAVVGPESTGKSTLARTLAQRFSTRWVPEHARALLELAPDRAPTLEDMERIARGQRAAESSLARQCARVLICDTDVLTTSVWSERLFSQVPERVRAWAEADRYAHTLLCDVDVPWVADPVRYLPDDREGFFRRIRDALDRAGREYTVVRGSWDERLAVASRAVERVLSAG